MAAPSPFKTEERSRDTCIRWRTCALSVDGGSSVRKLGSFGGAVSEEFGLSPGVMGWHGGLSLSASVWRGPGAALEAVALEGSWGLFTS